MWEMMTNLARDYMGQDPFANQQQHFPSASNSRFQAYYQCFSSVYCQKGEVEKGNKILLPTSALSQLARLDVDWPMLFEVTNTSERRSTHCGVLEFSAEEGRCCLPYWMMQNLLLKEGDFILITNTTLPKGTYVKIQPCTSDFLELSNHRAVLENSLRHFACLSTEDVIAIPYNDKVYEIEILETRPAGAVSIIEVDVEVDFAPPKDYVEPKPSSTAQAANAQSAEDGYLTDTSNSEAGFALFRGEGYKLDGTRIDPSEDADMPPQPPTNLAPWLHKIPGGVRTSNKRYSNMLAKGRCRQAPRSNISLFQGEGHRMD